MPPTPPSLRKEPDRLLTMLAVLAVFTLIAFGSIQATNTFLPRVTTRATR